MCLRGQRKSGFRQRSEYTRRVTVWPAVSIDYQTGEEEGRAVEAVRIWDCRILRESQTVERNTAAEEKAAVSHSTEDWGGRLETDTLEGKGQGREEEANGKVDGSGRAGCSRGGQDSRASAYGRIGVERKHGIPGELKCFTRRLGI